MQASKFSHFIKKNKYFRSGSRYGLAAALFSIIAFILLFALGENPLITNKSLDFFLIPLFVIVGIIQIWLLNNPRNLKFWEGITTGFFTYFVAAIISSIFIWIFLAIDSNLLQDYIQYSREFLLNQKKGIVDEFGIETYKNNLRGLKNMTPFDLVADDFLRKIIIGFLISVIFSIIMMIISITFRRYNKN